MILCAVPTQHRPQLLGCVAHHILPGIPVGDAGSLCLGGSTAGRQVASMAVAAGATCKEPIWMCGMLRVLTWHAGHIHVPCPLQVRQVVVPRVRLDAALCRSRVTTALNPVLASCCCSCCCNSCCSSTACLRLACTVCFARAGLICCVGQGAFCGPMAACCRCRECIAAYVWMWARLVGQSASGGYRLGLRKMSADTGWTWSRDAGVAAMDDTTGLLMKCRSRSHRYDGAHFAHCKPRAMVLHS